MKAVVKSITRENLDDIPEPCRSCLYWEFPEDSEKKKLLKSELIKKKKEWFLQTLREFGNCGKIAYQNKVPVGYAQYAPFNRLPQASNYKSGPLGRIENCTVFLSCLYITKKALRGRGIGMKLLESVILDLKRQCFKAVETFARRGSSNNPSGPIEFYSKKGFHIKDETNPEFPLVKLEL